MIEGGNFTNNTNLFVFEISTVNMSAVNITYLKTNALLRTLLKAVSSSVHIEKSDLGIIDKFEKESITVKDITFVSLSSKLTLSHMRVQNLNGGGHLVQGS